MSWWEDLTPESRALMVSCHHPRDARYLLCPQVEKCAVCLNVRFVTDKRWKPTPVLRSGDGLSLRP